MPPKQRPTAVILATQRGPQVQTGGGGHSLLLPTPSDPGRAVFKLPLELFLEIFSHFDDHRRYIRDTTGDGVWLGEAMRTQHVERSTVIRKLTMTCWGLRSTLLPILWKDTEGCVVEQPYDAHDTGTSYGLYAQCVYLLSNPTIATYVQWV